MKRQKICFFESKKDLKKVGINRFLVNHFLLKFKNMSYFFIRYCKFYL